MGYVTGETILDDEYNTFVNSSSSPYGYNHFAGTGALAYGLGQTALATVGAGDTVTASQWNSLFTGMDNIANHTNDTLTSTAARTAGDPIAIKSALVADLASLAAEVAGGSTSASAISESAELESAAASGRWAASHVVEQSITFANNNQLRWFFNAGGTMRMKMTRTGNGGGSATSKDSSVDEMIAAIGNFDLKSQTSTRSGSGETVTTNGLSNGLYDLGTGYTVLLKLTQSSGTYTSMYVQISAKLNAAVASAVTVTMKWETFDPDGGDSAYTSGNLSSVDQYANFIGVTDVALHTVNPTTAQGLASVGAINADATVSNTTS
tara:strand:+ start:1076 stop:2044 length:969 start_codon:yes stop_codon:yes gene_type:complete